jgi:hypothetical protein
MKPIRIVWPLAISILMAIIGWALADGLSGTISQQIGGGISNGFDGGISPPAAAGGTPVTGCVGTGYDFTLACNSQYIATF